MKLSHLQYVLESLNQLPTGNAIEWNKEFNKSYESIDLGNLNFPELDASIKWFQDSAVRINTQLEMAKKQIQEKISQLYPQCLEHSDRAECFNFVASPDFNRQYRTLKMFPNTIQDIVSRLHYYVSWQHPGLEIGPGDGQWTPHLVAMDPLYLIDVHQEFLNNTVNNFQEPYRSRLRPYLIKHASLHTLPTEQFGLIFSWNTFNYFNLRFIEHYLGNLMPLLKPGGVIMFSYNNCERYECTQLFERDFMTFVPESI